MGGFKLDKSKHVKEKDFTLRGYVLGEASEEMEDEAMKIYAQNLGEAYQNWGINDQREEAYQLEFDKYQAVVAQRTALVDQELNKNQEKEIEALKIKAKKKNWDDDKLQGKIQDVLEKYAILRAERVQLIEQEEEKILKRNQSPMLDKLTNRAREIDVLMNKQNTNEVERSLMKQFDDTYKGENVEKSKKYEMGALRFYSMNSGFKLINSAMRTGKHLIKKIGEKVKVKKGTGKKGEDKIRTANISTKQLADQMIQSSNRFGLEKDTVLFRNSDLFGLQNFLGITGEEINNADDLFRVLKKRENSTVNGALGTDKAFLSTTIQKGGATSFQFMQVEYRILAPKGTKGVYMEPISTFKNEKEFLLQAGTMFRVLKVKKEGIYNPRDDIYNKSKEPKFEDDKIVVYMEAIQKNAVKKGKQESA
ncbi:MAG: hypothetical protein J6N21_18210 [Butyrivibrio sp.]|nr:hypothetical protein [Butyrivibrio sp.]